MGRTGSSLLHTAFSSCRRTRLSDFTFPFHFHALEKEMAAHSSVPAWRIPAWWAAVYGVAQSRTRLKRLSSSNKHRLLSRCSARASHCSGFSRCEAWALGCVGSVVGAHGLSCPVACGIFLEQGSNPCPLHWQAGAQLLGHQGSSLFNSNWLTIKNHMWLIATVLDNVIIEPFQLEVCHHSSLGKDTPSQGRGSITPRD